MTMSSPAGSPGVAPASIANGTVLVTGANRGIGRALVEAALARGAERVYACGTHALTQAFLPLLTRSRGAIVNVLSTGALAAIPIIPTTRSGRAGEDRLLGPPRLQPHLTLVHHS
jgi:NAD(P)-dependent dehydrogenase (short-subunit alcohol dehydrogenase family)